MPHSDSDSTAVLILITKLLSPFDRICQACVLSLHHKNKGTIFLMSRWLHKMGLPLQRLGLYLAILIDFDSQGITCKAFQIVDNTIYIILTCRQIFIAQAEILHQLSNYSKILQVCIFREFSHCTFGPRTYTVTASPKHYEMVIKTASD